MFNATARWVAGVLVLIVLGGGGLAWWSNRPEPSPPQPAASVARASAETANEPLSDPRGKRWNAWREKARQLQIDKNWCAAADAWSALQNDLAKVGGEEQLKAEVEANLKIAKDHCKPASEPVAHVDAPPMEEPPEHVPEDRVLKFYWPGKTVRSVSDLDISGSGENQQWFFKGEANFAYQYRVLAETKVIANDGRNVEFELWFKELKQLRAVSDQEIEISWPDSPILALVWEQVEEEVLDPVPVYRLLKKAAQTWESVDPKFKRSLTWLHETLKRHGYKLDDSDEIEIVSQIEQFSGAKFRLKYVSGAGITTIDVLNGEQFAREDLIRLAYNSSLFWDCFIGKVADLEEGDSLELAAQDVGRIATIGQNVDIRGKVELRRGRSVPRHGEEQMVLDVEGGEVALASDEGMGTLEPAGTIWYSPAELLVREARITWKGSTSWMSKDHLLFGAQKVRNAKVATYYEAEIVDGGPRGGSDASD